MTQSQQQLKLVKLVKFTFTCECSVDEPWSLIVPYSYRLSPYFYGLVDYAIRGWYRRHDGDACISFVKQDLVDAA